MNQPTITVTETLPKELSDEICAPLGAYNRQQNPDFFAKRDLPEHVVRNLSVVARDSAGKLLGGLLGETQFAWLKIDILTVAPEARSQGIGSLLMRAAESEGRARGCRYVYVDTMSYQAPIFYEKLGYTIAGKLPDWDSHGHDKFLFVKRLSGTT